MDAARPLRDVFADLAGDETARQAHAADPEGFLDAAGHPELPADLVTEAIVSYADTAPAEVAEHLAPFVMANGPVPLDDAGLLVEMDAPDGLDLLATAPAEVGLDADLMVEPHAGIDGVGAQLGADAGDLDAGDLDGGDLDGGDLADPFALDFGHGDPAGLVATGQYDAADEPADAADGLADPGWLGDTDPLDGSGAAAAAGADERALIDDTRDDAQADAEPDDDLTDL